MNTTNSVSKNRRRKDRRSRYHNIVNALKQNPNDQAALSQLAELKRRYYRDVDGQLAGLDSEKREGQFVGELANQILGQGGTTGWVTVNDADGNAVRIRADLHEYVDDRLRRASRPGEDDPQRVTRASGLAAQQLVDRAVSRIHRTALKVFNATKQ